MACVVECSAGFGDVAGDWCAAIPLVARSSSPDLRRTTQVPLDADAGDYGAGAGRIDLCGIGSVCHAQH